MTLNPGSPSKPEPSAGNDELDRLAQALLNRGLAAREEIDACRDGTDEPLNVERLLKKLVKTGVMTKAQAMRVFQESSSLQQQQIPGFQLMDKLGQGSMGTVYKARQLSMNRLVAIKMLHPKLAAKQELLDRLVKEAHLAAKLSHNNIVQAIDVGSAGNLHYFVMEYVEGTTIRHELEAGKVFSEKEAVGIVLQVAQALQHAHRRGLIHRDVKPANIMITPERVAKVADLGMARETADEEMARAERGMTIGTPFYIAPEQIYGREDIDARADIYSLGATFYHMVTGQPPFPGTNIDQVLDDHLKKELTPPDHLNLSLSSGLGEVVEFCMSKSRGKRYRSMDDLILDLECLVAGQPPKLARERMDSGTLANLATGVAEDEEEDAESGKTRSLELARYKLWTTILAIVAGLSILANLILLLTRKGE